MAESESEAVLLAASGPHAHGGRVHWVRARLRLYPLSVHHRETRVPRSEGDPFDVGGYQLARVEVLLLAAAIVAMGEQIKVAKPGVNNTFDVLLPGVIAIIQIVIFALAAAKVSVLGVIRQYGVSGAHTHKRGADGRCLPDQRCDPRADNRLCVGGPPCNPAPAPICCRFSTMAAPARVLQDGGCG
jgi:hypothetical protein